MPLSEEIDLGAGWIRVGQGLRAPPFEVCGTGWPPRDKHARLSAVCDLHEEESKVGKQSSCRKQLQTYLDSQKPEGGWVAGHGSNLLRHWKL